MMDAVKAAAASKTAKEKLNEMRQKMEECNVDGKKLSNLSYSSASDCVSGHKQQSNTALTVINFQCNCSLLLLFSHTHSHSLTNLLSFRCFFCT
jgi:hypothetical protein